MHKIGRRAGFRQRLIATAVVFFKRFYTKQSFLNFDPLLVVPTLLFIAGKAEEWHCKAEKILKATKTYVKEYPLGLSDYPYLEKDLLECEFYALEVLEYDLVVYHPYRPLLIFLNDFGLNDLTETAWSIVNDSLRTDLSLHYPPHLIALAAIYIALSFSGRDHPNLFKQALEPSHDKTLDVTTEILNLYEFYSKPPANTQELLKKLFDLVRENSINFK